MDVKNCKKPKNWNRRKWRIGTRPAPGRPPAKLSDHDVELIRKLVTTEQITQAQAAEKFEISKSHVCGIVNFKRR